MPRGTGRPPSTWRECCPCGRLLVKVYAWKLILAKEGILGWAAEQTHTSWIIEGLLSIPGLEGSSLSTSPLGTFMVFVYIWLPYMILPMQAALERGCRTRCWRLRPTLGPRGRRPSAR